MKVVIESRRAGLGKAFVYGIATLIIYALFFSNQQLVFDILARKDYVSALFSMGLTVLVASVFGTAVSKFLKHTLEKALESQCLREE